MKRALALLGIVIPILISLPLRADSVIVTNSPMPFVSFTFNGRGYTASGFQGFDNTQVFCQAFCTLSSFTNLSGMELLRVVGPSGMTLNGQAGVYWDGGFAFNAINFSSSLGANGFLKLVGLASGVGGIQGFQPAPCCPFGPFISASGNWRYTATFVRSNVTDTWGLDSLKLTAVPEPGTFVLVIGALPLLIRRHFRRTE